MTTHIRQVIIVFFLVMSFIPFLLLTDLFPFMRFAMFAETVEYIPQREKFTIRILLPDGSTQLMSERQIGLDDSHLNYLARTYFYTQQLVFFAGHLKKSGLIKTNERLVVVHEEQEGMQWKKTILFDQ
jgi:hypothetical protein